MTTNFLWAPGTSNNGLLATALSLMTTELNTLASGSAAVSSVGGASGVFTNLDTAQAILADMFITLGAIGSALSAGAAIYGWFLQSYDGGTTYETSGAALTSGRPPDFIFSLPAATVAAASVFKSTGKVTIPALKFKAVIYNSTGQSFASSANVLRLAPQAMQY